MGKLLLVLIHNEENLRLRYLNTELFQVLSSLNHAGESCQLLQIGKFENTEFSNYAYFKRMILNELYSINSTRSNFVSKAKLYFRFIRKILQSIIQLVTQKVLISRQSLSSTFHKIQIEDQVSRKHILALNSFLESKYDHLVVFESDAIINDRDALCEQIRYVFQNFSGRTITLFNSHYSLCELGIAKNEIEIISNGEEPNLLYEIPSLATNTLCSYGMSRPLAEELTMALKIQKGLPLPPADWMFDQAFKKLLSTTSGSIINYKSIFFAPSLIENGSLKGVYTSGIQS